MRRIAFLTALVLALALFAGSALAQETVTVTLAEQNNSGQTGTATLTAMGDQTEVVIDANVGPAGAGVAQPNHIHTGTCGADLGGVAHPLTNLADGAGTTVVDVKLADLQTGDFAVNLHKSADEVSVYTACGNIPAAAMLPTTGGESPLANWLWLAGAGAVIFVGGWALRRRMA